MHTKELGTPIWSRGAVVAGGSHHSCRYSNQRCAAQIESASIISLLSQLHDLISNTNPVFSRDSGSPGHYKIFCQQEMALYPVQASRTYQGVRQGAN
jgi:hypothetical protein